MCKEDSSLLEELLTPISALAEVVEVVEVDSLAGMYIASDLALLAVYSLSLCVCSPPPPSLRSGGSGTGGVARHAVSEDPV